MKIIKLVTVEEEAIEKVICDRCGKDLTRNEVRQGNYCSIRYVGGYGSIYPEDMDELAVELCEPCLKELVGDFARITKNF